MTVSKKIKTIDKKIEQNKAQQSLGRQTAKISALSSDNVSKYAFLTVQDVEKDLLEKAATIKRFEYSSLGSELKKQIDITKKQYQGLGKVCGFDKKLIIIKYNKSDLVYNTVHSFYKYHDINKFNKLSIESKHFFSI